MVRWRLLDYGTFFELGTEFQPHTYIFDVKLKLTINGDGNGT